MKEIWYHGKLYRREETRGNKEQSSLLGHLAAQLPITETKQQDKKKYNIYKFTLKIKLHLLYKSPKKYRAT